MARARAALGLLVLLAHPSPASAQDTTPPTLEAAFVYGGVYGGGRLFQLSFSEDLQKSNLPPASAFTVTVNGSAVTVSSFLRNHGAFSALEIWVSPVVRRGQTVVVSYTDPTSGDDANAIQDTAGNDVASFTTGSGGVPAVINESSATTPGAPTVGPPPPPPGPPPPPPGPSQTVPGAPRNLLADATDRAVTLTWEAPENDGGSEITDYEYRIDRRNPWISIGSTQTTHTVTGLDNGTEYVFEVRAVNKIGKSFSFNRAEATPEAPEVFTLDFAHFANGTGITSDFVFVNVSPHPIGPALYFYDQEGDLIDPESVVDVTGDLEVTEDGSLSVLTEMESLGELTISPHGQGELVSGSVKVLSDGPIGGGLRYGVPEIGVAVVGAGPPVGDALFPVRRQEEGINTGVAIPNLGEEAMEARCELMREGVLRDFVSISLEANGQTSWLIDQAFPAADTSDFTGSVRCDAVGQGLFSAVALEMDSGNRTFTTPPVFRFQRGFPGNSRPVSLSCLRAVGE